MTLEVPSLAVLIAGILVACLYATLTTCLYYLGSRALITRFIWSRYPARLDAFMLCAACSGFWYGLFVGIIGSGFDLPFLVFPGATRYTALLVAFCSMVWTPWMAAKHLGAIDAIARLDQGQGPPQGSGTPPTEEPPHG